LKNVLIVGAGPAGLFAANELADSFDVTVIEEKPRVGGAGLGSDGKLNFHPRIGGDLTEFLSENDALDLLDYINQVFKKNGVDENDNFYMEKQKELEAKTTKAGIKFIPIKQKHIGSDRLPNIMEKFRRNLMVKGVKFELNTRALDLINGEKLKIKTDKGNEECDYVLLSPGRSGCKWLIEICKKLNLEMQFNPVDVGIRIEVLNDVMNEIIYEYKSWDPKFHVQTSSYDDFVRTFCTCPSGYVAVEEYGDSMFGVNGFSMHAKKSNNTNFALLVRISLTEPLENTTEYARSIVQQTNILGGGKPILQRLGDLRQHRRSTWERIERSFVKPTLTEVTPGDISMAYPHRILQDVLESLQRLGKAIPGIDSDSTLLYAPEIKFYAMRIKTNKNLQTKIPNIFVAGDGAGISRGIVGAAATGIIAARGILASR